MSAKPQPASWKTTKKERRNYIVGDLARAVEGYIITAFMSTFLIFQGINLAAIAGVMLFVKIIDAFDDVIFGYLVDKIHVTDWKLTKKIAGNGKYLPWYRLTFLFFPLFTILFFLMPASFSHTGKLVWFVVFYLLYDFSYTLVDVPMNSMIITLTDDIEERDSLLQTKTILSAIGTIGAGVVWTVLISEKVGFSIRSVAIVSSVILFIFMLPLAFGVKEHNTQLANVDEEKKQHYTFKDMINCIKTNKYLLVLLLSTVVSQCLMTGGAVGTFVSYYFYGSSLVLIIPIAIAFVPQLIAQMQVKRLAMKYGKKRIFLITGITGAVLYSFIFFFGKNFIFACVFLVLQAIPGNMSNVAKSFLLPDTIEYARFKTGKDCSGICYSMQSFVTKLTSSVASSLGLFILGLSNWIPLNAESFEDVAALGIQQPAEAMNVLWIIYSLIPTIGTLLGVLALVLYNLNDKDASLMAKCNSGEITRDECIAQLSRKY